MIRYPDWEYKLGCFLEEVKDRGRVLSWPHTTEKDWDCGMFVCEAILRMTGRPVHTWVNCYNSWRQLARLMGNPEMFCEYVAGRMAAAEIPPCELNELRKGDVAVVRLPNGRPAITLCMGNTLAAPDENGLQSMSTAFAVAGYRIG